MSLLSWFTRKNTALNGEASISAEPAPNPPTQPSEPSSGGETNGGTKESRSVARKIENAALREQLRSQSMARREQLYASVRESLLKIGVLASSYRFKVLALDQSARQYLVMIDLSTDVNHNPAQMMGVEKLIAENAKSQYDIVVAAVYWRVEDPIAEVGQKPEPISANPSETVAKTQETAGPRNDPLQTEEMLAFKRALAATAASPTPASSTRAPARNFSPLATGYEDTQVVAPDTLPPGLGETQYGNRR